MIDHTPYDIMFPTIRLSHLLCQDLLTERTPIRVSSGKRPNPRILPPYMNIRKDQETLNQLQSPVSALGSKNPVR